MRALATLVMRGRFQAAIVAALAAVLFVLVPPALIVSAAAVALATLRRGGREGGLVVAVAALCTTVLITPFLATAAPEAVLWMLLFWPPVWLLAMTLRVSVSLGRTLQLAAALGGLAVLGFYAVLVDPGAWWRGMLNEVKQVLLAAGLVTDGAGFEGLVVRLAPLMPGLMVAYLLAYMLLGLLLGRWWQALLFNPGGFRAEFHELRLGRESGVVAIAVFGLAIALGWPLMVNLAMVLGVIYLLQGIALVHGLIAKASLSGGWLVGFYVSLLLALPQLSALLCLLGVVDAWVDLRARIKPPAR